MTFWPQSQGLAQSVSACLPASPPAHASRSPDVCLGGLLCLASFLQAVPCLLQPNCDCCVGAHQIRGVLQLGRLVPGDLQLWQMLICAKHRRELKHPAVCCLRGCLLLLLLQWRCPLAQPLPAHLLALQSVCLKVCAAGCQQLLLLLLQQPAAHAAWLPARGHAAGCQGSSAGACVALVELEWYLGHH